MIPDDQNNTLELETLPFLTRVWWTVWGAPWHTHHGWRYWCEGIYIWLGKRLPAGLVFYATDQLVVFADERGLPINDIVEAQSEWLIERMR